VRLFGRASETVRARSAAHDHATGPKELAALARHDEAIVRRAVAANPSTPPSTLERLARDDDPQVRVEVATNPATPPAALRALVRADSGGGFAGVARRKVLLAVATHPNVTPELRRLLANDADALVARKARA
jgi:hypothetical protein